MSLTEFFSVLFPLSCGYLYKESMICQIRDFSAFFLPDFARQCGTAQALVRLVAHSPCLFTGRSMLPLVTSSRHDFRAD